MVQLALFEGNQGVSAIEQGIEEQLSGAAKFQSNTLRSSIERLQEIGLVEKPSWKIQQHTLNIISLLVQVVA